MSHKRICATILALSLIGLSSPSGATGNAVLQENLKDPLDFNEVKVAPSTANLDVQQNPAPTLETSPSEVTSETTAQPADEQEVPPPAEQLSELEQTIKALLTDGISGQQIGFSGKQVDALAEAYSLRNYRPIWFEDQSLLPLANKLILALRGAKTHGLDPQNYSVRQLASVLDLLEASNDTATIFEIAQVELQLTRAFAIYSAHIAGGVVSPTRVLKKVYITPSVPKLESLLPQLEELQSVDQIIAGLEPQTPSYNILKEQLERYSEVLASHYPVFIEDGPSLRPGDTGVRVQQLMKRLATEGYTPPFSAYSSTNESDDNPMIYSDDMAEVVKSFQKLHGLTIDGIVGKQTRAALNTSLEDRRDQIIVNLERMRWDDPIPEGRYVIVNVAEQMVRVMEGTEVLYQTRSVVGKPRNATPLFSDVFEYAEINPTWGVPWSIATNEYLPKLRGNPAALSGSGINVYKNGKLVDPTQVDWNSVSKRKFGYQLRQKAGRKNALGAVKYMFPNKHNIYLHDTPSKRLFNKDQRAFSHGCIRIQDPFTFGEVLLANSGHSRAKMENLRARGKTTRLKLTESVPVHLRYYTAFANDDGDIQFRTDIYKQDKAILKALQAKQYVSPINIVSTY